MGYPKQVEIVEVGPRDGLQMLARPVPTADKVSLIGLVRDAGLRRIETVSFVSPKHVPQMADAEDVLAAVRTEPFAKMALALNERGYRRAIESKVDWICYVTAATETMSGRNANTTVADGVAATKECIAEAHAAGIKVRASIAVCWVCPYEGAVPEERVIGLAREFAEAGADEIAFNDTVGRAVPSDVFSLCRRAAEAMPGQGFAGHFHDTNFTALANIYAALEAGWAVFDAAAGGLGGCPFSPGASGNVATEKVVWMLERMGVETGIDLEKLRAAASFAQRLEASAK